MRVGALVQSRMSSQRLPGKMLMPLAGRPLLAHVLDRLEAAAQVDTLAVATSSDPSDDPIAEFCARRGAYCHRGPLDDVALRFVEAARELGLDAFVRISGDSPLIDPALVDEAVERWRETGADVVTNIYPERSFPSGQSVEVVSVAAYEAAQAKMTEPYDREHVTPYLYSHADELTVESLHAGEDLSDVDLSLDTKDDLARIEELLTRATPRTGWRELAAR
jgi:spore coat polysaccharide biosynthesis protein SpsF (cytidylyltransferase family)